MTIFDLEQDISKEWYIAFLNNLKCLIRFYDCLAYKADFILLPGDEIVEKKHQNIKTLTAKAMK